MPAPQPAPAAPRTDVELSEFLLRACHDLRGPLRAVRIHTELLVKNGVPANGEDSERSFGHIVNGASSAGAVVDGISDYALALAINSSRFQSVPLDILVRSAMAKLAATIRETGARVEYGELPSVPGDYDRLLQLFEYLLDQALRRRGNVAPIIRISAEQGEGSWLFTVSDNGNGLAGSLDKVFTPFARLYSNQRPGPGLAVCQAIVERHGGRIWVDETPQGCLFRFTLPE